MKGADSARGVLQASGAKVSVVLFIVVALMSLGVSFTLAAPPFEVSIDEPIDVSDFTVTLTGTADSPSSATHHLVVEWGDGNTDTLPDFTTDAPWAWGPLEHTYSQAGTYTITTTLIHSQDSGNDRGSASDSATVEIREPEPPVVEPPVVEPPTTPSEVKGQVFKKPAKLAKTGPETTTAVTIMGLVILLAGATLYMLSFNDVEELLQ